MTATPYFPAWVYPSPVPFLAQGAWPGLTGCANPAGLEEGQLPLDTALQVLNEFMGAGDLKVKRNVSDPAIWNSLKSEGRADSLPRDWVSTPQPASGSEYAGTLAALCGKGLLDQSWWLKVCPAPCKEAEVSSPALIGHVFLLKRQGHWLVWATYP